MIEQPTTLASQTNLLDPKVVFDPLRKTTSIITPWQSNDVNDPENAAAGVNIKPHADMTKINGVIYPMVLIDNQLVQSQYIKKFILIYKNFTPELVLTIANYPELKLNTPGMVNRVTVVMVPPVDGTYKKISIDFYITSRTQSSDGEVYFCSYFFPELQLKFTKSIKSETNKLNTFNFLKTIASNCQLGFASTDMCENIPDTKIRLMRNQTYTEHIAEHIKFGGIDTYSIFDTWIDVYGYLVLVNVGWIFSAIVASNELSMKELVGSNMADGMLKAETIKYSDEDVIRTFTNWKMQGKKVNNRIVAYSWEIDNSLIIGNGTNNTYFYLDHLVNGSGNNGIQTTNIKIEEGSADSKNYPSAYNFQNNKFLGVEMGGEADGNTPVLIQERIRNAFFAKNKSKILKVELEVPNTNIERGTLINIMIYEFDRATKQQLLLNTENLESDGNLNGSVNDEIDPKMNNALLEDDSLGVPNLEASGIFYVDGMEYVYDEQQKIKQTLYLIKHSGVKNSYLNHSSIPKNKNIMIK